MNIGNIKVFLGVLDSTLNLLCITKQSKELLYIDNLYRGSDAKSPRKTPKKQKRYLQTN